MYPRPNGFTLIEAMVALVIFSVMTAGFGRYIGDEARQISYLSDKTIAAIIAANVIDKIRLEGWPTTGESTQKVTMANQQWNVEVDIEKTDSEDMERLDVSVSRMVAPNDSQQQALVTMVGFVGKH